MLLLGVGIC